MPQIAAGPYTAIGCGTTGVPSTAPLVLTQRAGYNIVIDKVIFNTGWGTAPGTLHTITFSNANISGPAAPSNFVSSNSANYTLVVGSGATMVGNSRWTQVFDFTVDGLGGGPTFTPASTDVAGSTNVLNIYTNTVANVSASTLHVVYHYEKS